MLKTQLHSAIYRPMIFFSILAIFGTLSGCQSVSPTKGASEQDVSSGSPERSSIDNLDEKTREMLKRHDINYPKWTGDREDKSPSLSELIPAPTQTDLQPEQEEFAQPRRKKYALQIPPKMSHSVEETPDTLFQDVTHLSAALADPCLAAQKITVNFNQAEILSVINTISDITGINFIIDDGITGTVTVLSPQEIRLGDLFNFFESILQVKGFAAIPTKDHVKIISLSHAPKQNLPVRVGADPAGIPRTDSLVNQIIPVRYADAASVADLLENRLPAGATLSVYRPTNTIIITGSSASIHILAKIIQRVDVPGSKDIITMIPLQYASAKDMAVQISDLTQQKATPVVPGRRTLPAAAEGMPKIQAEPRTNTLIVTANQQDTEIISQLVEKLDIPRPAGTDDYHVVYLQNAQAEEMATALQPMLAGLISNIDKAGSKPISLQAEPSTNSLIINASPQEYEVISSLVKKLDIVREQILVELLIIELGNDKISEIGIDWATMDQAVPDGVRFFGNTDFGIINGFMSGDSQGLNVGMFKDVGGDVKIGALLNALGKVSDVNILSTPSIVTQNHSQAKFIVGDNIPFVTKERVTETDPSTPTVIREIDYKDVGVTLEITPHISRGGTIRLQISSVFDNLIDNVTGLSADTPTTAKRQIETEISMAHGGTLVIGGLIRDDVSKIEQKVPILGDIPLLGELFKYKRDRLQKKNLLLFITPYILGNPAESEAITQQKREQIAPEFQHSQNSTPSSRRSY